MIHDFVPRHYHLLQRSRRRMMNIENRQHRDLGDIQEHIMCSNLCQQQDCMYGLLIRTIESREGEYST